MKCYYKYIFYDSLKSVSLREVFSDQMIYM